MYNGLGDPHEQWEYVVQTLNYIYAGRLHSGGSNTNDASWNTACFHNFVQVEVDAGLIWIELELNCPNVLAIKDGLVKR